MVTREFFDFTALSKLPFKEFLDYLNVPYKETKTELKGEGFIINKAKNLYFNPIGDDKGSVINFLSSAFSNLSRASSNFSVASDNSPLLVRMMPSLKDNRPAWDRELLISF